MLDDCWNRILLGRRLVLEAKVGTQACSAVKTVLLERDLVEVFDSDSEQIRSAPRLSQWFSGRAMLSSGDLLGEKLIERVC